MKAITLVVGLLAVAGITTCAGNSDKSISSSSPLSSSIPLPVQLSPEDRAAIESFKKEKREREQIQHHPDKFIQVITWEWYNKGIVNDYARVTSVTLKNNSNFDVRDIRGKFRYFSCDWDLRAEVPITVTGELFAGKSKKLKVDANEISGKVCGGELLIESVTVRP